MDWKDLKVTQERGWYAVIDDSLYLLVDGWMRLPGYVTIMHVVDDSVNEDYAGKWFHDFGAEEDVPRLYATKDECVEANKLYWEKHAKSLEAETAKEDMEISELYWSLGRFKHYTRSAVLQKLVEKNGDVVLSKYSFREYERQSAALTILSRGYLKYYSNDITTCIPLSSIIAYYLNSEGDTVVRYSPNDTFTNKGSDLFEQLQYVFKAL